MLESFFKKVAGPVNMEKCLRTAFFIEHLWWLLLLVWAKLVYLKLLIVNIKAMWFQGDRVISASWFYLKYYSLLECGVTVLVDMMLLFF